MSQMFSYKKTTAKSYYLGEKKKATIYSHNMNKSQKHDGEREDIQSQLYEVPEQTTLSYQYAENSHVHTIY